MRRILVPYHLDEPLDEPDFPLDPDLLVTADLPDGSPWDRMAKLYDEVATAVTGAVGRGERPLVMSGDCTTSFGTVAGMQRAGLDPAIVWLDAHGDVQTLETTTSGYLGGMPLRMLVGYRPDLVADPLGLRTIAEEEVLLVDARDLDPPEVEYLERAAIRRCGVDDLNPDMLPGRPIYLHIDVDVADPSDLPGLLIPAPDGPSLESVLDAVTRMIASGRVAAVGLACTWQPGGGAAERLRPLLEPL